MSRQSNARHKMLAYRQEAGHPRIQASDIHATRAAAIRHWTRQYTSTVSDAPFTGFDGAETARDLRIVENYVRGIDTACRP